MGEKTHSAGKRSAARLSLPQVDLLVCLSKRETQDVARKYSTAWKLRGLGLVTIEDVPPPFGWRLRITDAGRQALAHHDQEKGNG